MGNTNNKMIEQITINYKVIRAGVRELVAERVRILRDLLEANQIGEFYCMGSTKYDSARSLA